MYTDPKIISSEDLKTRAYILFYFEGKRVRLYNGKQLGKQLYPNKATNLKNRNKLLNELLF